MNKIPNNVPQMAKHPRRGTPKIKFISAYKVLPTAAIDLDDILYYFETFRFLMLLIDICFQDQGMLAEVAPIVSLILRNLLQILNDLCEFASY